MTSVPSFSHPPRLDLGQHRVDPVDNGLINWVAIADLHSHADAQRMPGRRFAQCVYVVGKVLNLVRLKLRSSGFRPVVLWWSRLLDLALARHDLDRRRTAQIAGPGARVKGPFDQSQSEGFIECRSNARPWQHLATLRRERCMNEMGVGRIALPR